MFSYFTDPVLRAPTLASMLMCLSSSLVGVLVFIRRRSLLGEALSHAAYPGVVLSALFLALFFPFQEDWFAFLILIGGGISSFLALWGIEFLERKKVKSDAALSFVLTFFFGLGVLLASRMQMVYPLFYQKIQVFLYGQVATMTDQHIVLYGALSVLIICLLFFLYYPIQAVSFDRSFSSSIGVKTHLVDQATFFLLVLAIVIGMRSVGVVLMSGMLIAPCVAARQITHRLNRLFFFSALIGICSGFLGNYLSLEIPLYLIELGIVEKLSLPTGPMILLCASFFCLITLFFARERGLFFRCLRIIRFRQACLLENLLKRFWKEGKEVSFSQIATWQELSPFFLRFILFRLICQGWIEKKEGYVLTKDGEEKASHIVRLHRLWEVYLVYLGQGIEKVHASAEEMEHILTPEIEKELTDLLKNPKLDPHKQPIPEKK